MDDPSNAGEGWDSSVELVYSILCEKQFSTCSESGERAGDDDLFLIWCCPRGSYNITSVYFCHKQLRPPSSPRVFCHHTGERFIFQGWWWWWCGGSSCGTVAPDCCQVGRQVSACSCHCFLSHKVLLCKTSYYTLHLQGGCWYTEGLTSPDVWHNEKPPLLP